MLRRGISLLIVLVLAALALECWLILHSIAATLLVAALVWFALPGVVLVRRALGPPQHQAGHALLLGPILGLACGTVGLLLLWALRLPAAMALAAAPLLTWGLAFRPARTLGSLLRTPTLRRSDALAALALLALVPAVTMIPFARVGEVLPDGARAYRAYFTADFVWAMSVVAELSKGDVPPANPFLQSAGLNYYWLSHLLSGVEYRLLQPHGVTLAEVILVNAVGYGLAFVACFYWLLRAVGVSPVATAAACTAGFLANSFEGFERLLWVREGNLPLDTLRSLNIDAVTRWFYYAMPVDGLQRLLLYQPHHLVGYGLALLALWTVARATAPERSMVAFAAGVFLGAGFLFSTFTALIVGLATALLYAFRLGRARAWRAAVECALVGTAPVAVAVAISLLLGYMDPGQGSLLRIAINSVALKQWPFVMLLSFGPLLIGGVAGLLLARWSRADAAPAVALAAAATAFYFLADVPDMAGVWVGWRAGHLLLIAAAVLSGVALDTLWARGGAARWATAGGALILFLLALPTVLIDVYNAQDTDNREYASAFPWTLVLSRAELDGLEWIRRSTPADSIVQVDPRARDAGTWAYIPAFAERRMSAGLPISMIPLRPYRLGTDDVTFGIFHAQQPREAWEMARFLNIDYLVVGAPERERYGEAVDAFAADPSLFVPRFENEALAIYEVAAR